MKTLAEQLNALEEAEIQAWKIYSKSVVTQVNRLLEHMGLVKDFTMDDLAEIRENKKEHDFCVCTISDKALAYSMVQRYAWVKICREKWNKALSKVMDFRKQIEEVSKQ